MAAGLAVAGRSGAAGLVAAGRRAASWLLVAAAVAPAALAAPADDAPAPPVPAPLADTSRLVTLGGDVTEIVTALGLGARVVGADDASAVPDAPGVARLGYVRALSAEGIVSLAPTAVLASPKAGPPSTLEQLAAAGVPVAVVPDAESVDGAAAKITHLAALLDRRERGAELTRALRADADAVAQALRAVRARPRVLFVYARSATSLHVAGRGTPADTMITLAGGANAIGGFDGYKPLAPEAAVAAAPDVLLVPATTLATLDGTDALVEHPALALTPAGRARRVVALDDDALLGFGLRTGRALVELCAALHPELAAARDGGTDTQRQGSGR